MIAKFLQNKKLVSSIIIILLFLFIIYAALPFLSAFFGALILTFIFRPLNKKLKKSFSPQISASIIIIISLIVVIIPLFFLVNGLLNQARLLPNQLDNIETLINKTNDLLPIPVGENQEEFSKQIVNLLSKSLSPFLNNVSKALAILFLMFFMLYYFLIESEKLEQMIHDILPFTEKNKQRVINKFKEITYSTIIGTFFIALIQGGLLAMNFYLLDIPNPLFWGFVAAILSFLPVVGAPIIYIPAAVFLFLAGSIAKAIVILIAGFMISTIDNILRPIINDKYGKIHPLISIIGIYIGITQFGLVGLFIGPLLIAYLILLWQIYRDEYIKKQKI